MSGLTTKVNKAKNIISQACKQNPVEKIALAWTGGKDSTVLLHLARQIYPKDLPFLILFNDSTIEFPEIYEFIKKISQEWQLKLLWIKHRGVDLKKFHLAKNNEDKMEIMRIAKIHAIEDVVEKYKIQAIMSGIRWDEHPARSHEKYFSPRQNHLRVHPILHFTLTDIWEYIYMFNVPYVDLYDKGYKSLGEAPFTKPAISADAPERSGREATKEKVMARLRKLGYW